jgi:two-component system, LytTR family, response regulator
VTRYRALIVDDERLARFEIRCLLREHSQVEIAGEAESVAEAAALIEQAPPDLIFLDVKMPGESGFDLFERTRVAAHVVFVTAYDGYALRAFEVNALDYLLKPVDPERLAKTVTRFLAHTKPPAGSRPLEYSDSILLQVHESPRFVKLASLVSIRAEGDYTSLVATSGLLGLIPKSMREWEQLLPARHFCRIHRSTIINCEQVVRVEKWFNDSYRVHLKHLDEPLVMSRRLAAEFRQRFGI